MILLLIKKGTTMNTSFKILTLTALVLLTGCGEKSAALNYQAAPLSHQQSVPIAQSAPMPIKRIITKRADITVEVDNIEKASIALKELLQKEQGYIVNANSYEERYQATVKVPTKSLNLTLDNIAMLGKKVSQNISQMDVTNQMVNSEARLKNLMLFRDKMQNLLTQTTKIEEILKIERELRRVLTEIDSIEGQLKYLKDAVILSPISVNFREKTVYGPLGYIANGIWWVTKKLFVIK